MFFGASPGGRKRERDVGVVFGKGVDRECPSRASDAASPSATMQLALLFLTATRRGGKVHPPEKLRSDQSLASRKKLRRGFLAARDAAINVCESTTQIQLNWQSREGKARVEGCKVTLEKLKKLLIRDVFSGLCRVD